MSVTIPTDYMNRGPIPGDLVVTFLVAEEDSVEGVLVTTGAADGSVKRCTATDVPIGWSQGAMVQDKVAEDIHLFAPMLKVDVDSGSDALSYGDILAPAAAGKVAKASGSVVGVVAGICLLAAAAGGQTLMVPITSVPDPITT